MNEKVTMMFDEVEDYVKLEETNDKYEIDFKLKKMFFKYDLYIEEKITNINEYTRLSEFTKYIPYKYNNFYLYKKDEEFFYIRKTEQGNTLLVFKNLTDEEYLILKKYDKIKRKRSERKGLGYRIVAGLLFIWLFYIFMVLGFNFGEVIILPLIALIVIPAILFSYSKLTKMISGIKEEIGMK